MRVLIATKIFPSALEPDSAPFNRQQFAALAKLCEVKVLATIPHFPLARLVNRWSSAARLGAVPKNEQIDGLDVVHPRTLYVPKWSALSAGLYAASLWSQVSHLRGEFDVLLGAWAYPDAVAMVLLGQLLGLPTVMKLHGSDIDVLGERPLLRAQMRWAFARARRVVAVSRALAQKAEALGAPVDRVATVRNGVDTSRFFPRDRQAARAKLGLADRPTIVFVGRLERDKGVRELFQAHAELQQRQIALVLVGDGPERARGDDHGLVHAVGRQPFGTIADWIAASDVLALPSYHEGTPNVILEAHACGRPVVATRVGGIAELIDAPLLGELVPPRDAAALGSALVRVLERRHDAEAIVRACQARSWADSALELHRVLKEATV